MVDCFFIPSPSHIFVTQFLLQWNFLLWNLTAFNEAEFETLTILSMEKPENTSVSGVFVTAALQFGKELSLEKYTEEWIKISDDDSQLLEWKISNSSFKKVETCPEISSIQSKIPVEIWNASSLDQNEKPFIGTTLNLVCPSELKLSQDEDGYDPIDDQYTILCTTRKTYEMPKKIENWPTCVQSCPKIIPYVPQSKTGLKRVTALNSIPSGQYGKYICKETSLGVDRVFILDF